MRIPVFLFSFLAGMSMASAQMADQSPGAEQDAEAARQKILKVADQIDTIEANSEATKPQLEGMKSDIAKLQTDNAALKQQLSDLQNSFDQAQAAHAKEQKALLDTIAGMIAASKSSSGTTKPHSKKKEATEAKSPDANAAPAPSGDSSAVSTTPSTTSSSSSSADSTAPDATPAKSQKGYYHIVESGETLTLITEAYRQGGVHVTIAEIQKANGLTDKSVLKVGQKLFIPKPAN